MRHHPWKTLCLLTLSATLALTMGCNGDRDEDDDRADDDRETSASGLVQSENAAGLEELFKSLHQQIHTDKDHDQALATFRSLLPDEARLRKGLRDDVDPAIVQSILESHKRFSDNTDVEDLCDAGQTVVKAHGATTEEIAAYREGTIVFEEFPSGTKQLAERILRPGTTYYAVEFLEPGSEHGTKYHLLYWDGGQWSMIGPMWRVLD